MKIRTSLRAGGIRLSNHNERALQVKTGVHAGGVTQNHNERAR